jgi:hypothetical protein
MEGLRGYGKDFAFYSQCDGKSLKHHKQKSGLKPTPATAGEMTTEEGKWVSIPGRDDSVEAKLL